MSNRTDSLVKALVEQGWDCEQDDNIMQFRKQLDNGEIAKYQVSKTLIDMNNSYTKHVKNRYEICLIAQYGDSIAYIYCRDTKEEAIEVCDLARSSYPNHMYAVFDKKTKRYIY